MSGLIGDRKEKSALDEMIAFTQEFNEQCREEARIEEEKKARKEAKQKEAPKAPPKKSLIKKPSLGKIVDFCGNEIYKNDYDALKDVCSELWLHKKSIAGLYKKGKVKIESKRIYSLNLERMELTSLHKSIGLLTGLKELDLDLNSLTKLPDSIGRLVKLETLALSRNDLDSLPSSLERLAQLKGLYIFHNPLDQKAYGMMGRMKKRGVDVRY